MLQKTHTKIIQLFRKNHGYMNFEQLRNADVTVLQMREMEEEGALHRFARGWYWCSDCGLKKAADYRYIEIAKINPEAIICLDSACFLNGLNVKEPEEIRVATARDDRKKMEVEFPIKRYYLTYFDTGKYIQTKKTEFGSYRFFSMERALYDSFHAPGKLLAENADVIRAEYERNADRIRKYENYFRKMKHNH
ncbi:MAG: hypothetical protein K6E16_06015 [Lachnospiraceae bacterium]|nr:hypothetical protein [Lachnospiraceae bacterium]